MKLSSFIDVALVSSHFTIGLVYSPKHKVYVFDTLDIDDYLDENNLHMLRNCIIKEIDIEDDFIWIYLT